MKAAGSEEVELGEVKVDGGERAEDLFSEEEDTFDGDDDLNLVDFGEGEDLIEKKIIRNIFKFCRDGKVDKLRQLEKIYPASRFFSISIQSQLCTKQFSSVQDEEMDKQPRRPVRHPASLRRSQLRQGTRLSCQHLIRAVGWLVGHVIAWC